MALPPAQAAAPTEKHGDIVSEYKWLVLPFLAFNITSWVLTLLELAGIVGQAAYATMDLLYPVDISFCQMMFWGTLHYGPLNDGRLSLVCRIAFIIEAACYVVRNIVIFQPATLEDALAYLNTTAIGEPSVPSLSLIMGVLRAVFFFIVFGPFAAWIGTTCLQIGRRRLLANVPPAQLSSFSTSFLSKYVGVLLVQLGLCSLCTYLAATAGTPEDEVYANKINYTLRAVSGVCAQIFGWKAVIFDASGVSLRQWSQGKGRWLQTAAVACALIFVCVIAVDLTLFAFAVNSSDPILTFHNYLEVGFENAPMMGIWLFALINFGISLQHLNPRRSLDGTDEKFLEARRLKKENMAAEHKYKSSSATVAPA